MTTKPFSIHHILLALIVIFMLILGPVSSPAYARGKDPKIPVDRARLVYVVETPSYKLLDVPYIDQVYQQKKIQDADPRWYSRNWYLSGPTSINMVLSYFDCTKTYISITKSIAKIILADPYTEDGQFTNWYSIVPNLEVQCEIKSTLRRDAVSALTYEEIKKRIDGDFPILIGVRFGKVQHIMVIVGYIEPDIVIVNDPFGGIISSGWWITMNLPPAESSQKTEGYRIQYKFDDLKMLFSGRWLDIHSLPSVSSSIPAPSQFSIQIP